MAMATSLGKGRNRVRLALVLVNQMYSENEGGISISLLERRERMVWIERIFLCWGKALRECGISGFGEELKSLVELSDFPQQTFIIHLSMWFTSMRLAIRDFSIRDFSIRDFTPLQCLSSGGQELSSAEITLNKKSNKKKGKRR
jgi:hypothetical protein